MIKQTLGYAKRINSCNIISVERGKEKKKKGEKIKILLAKPEKT